MVVQGHGWTAARFCDGFWTVRPRGLDQSYTVSYDIKWVKTSWTYSVGRNCQNIVKCYISLPLTKSIKERLSFLDDKI